MPHAASGQLQLEYSTVNPSKLEFQCRTRQVVGCNVKVNQCYRKRRFRFNAARGR